MKIEIWCEGYLATGCEGIPVTAMKLGEYEAESFEDAILLYIENHPNEERYIHKRLDGSWRFWGCRLFDNEADARSSFG